MVSYADGGIFSTKPYICASSYMLRMSNYKKGDVIKTKVLDVSVENEKISLGIKQLEPDPFADGSLKLKRGMIITCVVEDVIETAASAELPVPATIAPTALGPVVEDVIENYEPRARLVGVRAFPNLDQNAYEITVEFFVVNAPTEVVVLDVMLEVLR